MKKWILLDIFSRKGLMTLLMCGKKTYDPSGFSPQMFFYLNKNWQKYLQLESCHFFFDHTVRINNTFFFDKTCGPKFICFVFTWGSTTLAMGFFECTILFDQHNFSLRSKEKTNIYGSPICTSCHPSRRGLEIAFILPLSITCPA